MNRKTTYLLAALSVLLISLVATTSVANDYSRIGVRAGDRAHYSIVGADHDRLGVVVNNVTGT